MKPKTKERLARWANTLTMGAVGEYFRESVGLTGYEDQDENKYRRMTSPLRDYTPMKFRRIMDGAFYLWQRNPMARRLISIVLDFALGNEIEVEVLVVDKDGGVNEEKSKIAQRQWEMFVNDPVNRFRTELPVLLQDREVFGELLLPVTVNEANGLVRYGLIDVGLITDVIKDATGRQVAAVKLKLPDSTEEKTLKVVHYDTSQEVEPPFPLLTGDALYFQANRVGSKSRGQSTLTEVMDWIDGLDQFMFNNLEGAALRNAFFYHMKLIGGTKEQVEAADTTPPKPGTKIVTNDKVEFNAISPALTATDTSESVRMFKNHILAAKGYPEHWFADGGGTNLATAGAMGIPVMQMLKRQQKEIKSVVEFIARFVVQQAIGRGLEMSDAEDFKITVNTIDFERQDATQLAASFVQTVTAMQMSVGKGWMSDDVAKSVVDLLVKRLGVEPDEEDAETLKKKVQEEKAEKDAEALSLYQKTAGVVPPGARGVNQNQSPAINKPQNGNQQPTRR